MKKKLFYILFIISITIPFVYKMAIGNPLSSITAIPIETTQGESGIIYRFIISSPPQNRDELLALIRQYQLSLNLGNNNYQLIFFKESKNSPLNFNADKGIPKVCNRLETEASCMEYDDIIVSLAHNVSGDLYNEHITLSAIYAVKDNKYCPDISLFSDGVVEECITSPDPFVTNSMRFNE